MEEFSEAVRGDRETIKAMLESACTAAASGNDEAALVLIVECIKNARIAFGDKHAAAIFFGIIVDVTKEERFKSLDLLEILRKQ